MHLPTLSLCLIARDEEQMLPACLESVTGVVDEVVVVDTGSEDGTMGIARAAGARVEQVDWAGCFSLPRNRAVAMATGDWVLLLDADERLATGAGAILRAALDGDDLDGDDLDCLFLRLHDAASLDASEDEVLSGRLRLGEPGWLPRVFRRTPDLLWEGVVHEQPHRWLLARQDRCGALPADIVHLGKVDTVVAERHKVDRYLHLLALRCDSDPRDVAAHVYLANARGHAGDHDGARAAIERAWAAYIEDLEGKGPSLPFVGLVATRAKLQLEEQDLDGMADTLGHAFRWAEQQSVLAPGLDHPNLLAVRGLFHELLARKTPSEKRKVEALQEAACCYEAALAQRGVAQMVQVDAGVTGSWSHARLGSALRQLGHLDAAIAVFDAALSGEGGMLREQEVAACMEGRDEARARLAWAPPGPAEGDAPTFIGGAGRSGTTLLRAMLGAHPRLYCPPEAKLVPAIAELCETWRGRGLVDPVVSPDLLDQATRAFLVTMLQGLARPGRRLAEKTPHNVVHIETLARILPEARFIHVLRDPRAVCASLVRQRWTDPDTGELRWYCRDLTSAARYWAQVIARARYGARCAPGRYLEVRYERLVAEPEQQMRRVLAFLGEEWDPVVLRHPEADIELPAHESSSDAAGRPIDPARADRWREELTEADVKVIEDVLGGLLGWVVV